MALALLALAVRHGRDAVGSYLSVAGLTRPPSTEYRVKDNPAHYKDLGCYDSGGEAEPGPDSERFRVRETPAMRDAV
jgi:hypothetical protein